MTRFEWTTDGFARVRAQGLDPSEVHRALSGPGPRLVEAVADDMLAVLVRSEAGRLLEIWMREDPDDDLWDVFAAFEAGFLGTAKWRNVFGEEEES